jgi:molybdopterin converting factor small subunit
METGTVTIEFYGIPRQRAGRAELAVRAGTIEELLGAVQQACPQLANLRLADGRLSPHYLLSIEGDGFVNDGARVLAPGDRVLLLSADAGG